MDYLNPRAELSELSNEALKRYEFLERFAHSELSETYLVKSRESNKLFTAKIYNKRFAENATAEREILSGLDCSALPKLIDSFEIGNSVCVVREYAEGVSLEKITESADERFILNVGVQLCDILTYLHSQNPPVIHRDIKPTNVIIDDAGIIRLIDFGIARRYSETASRDTTLMVSDGFAPPEQYGFKQTSAASDIYSLGALLCWLATGSSDISEVKSIKNKALARIIKKCAAFVSENRYKSAGAVKSALIAACDKNKRGVKKALIASAGLIAVVGLIFLARLTTTPPVLENGEADVSAEEIDFREEDAGLNLEVVSDLEEGVSEAEVEDLKFATPLAASMMKKQIILSNPFSIEGNRINLPTSNWEGVNPNQKGWAAGNALLNSLTPYPLPELTMDMLQNAEYLVIETDGDYTGEQLHVIWQAGGLSGDWEWNQTEFEITGEKTIAIKLSEMVKYDDYKNANESQLNLLLGYWGKHDDNGEQPNMDELGITKVYLLMPEDWINEAAEAAPAPIAPAPVVDNLSVYNEREYQTLVDFFAQDGNNVVAEKLGFDLQNPKTWTTNGQDSETYLAASIGWNNENPKKITEITLYKTGFNGALDFSNFDKLQWLWISNNDIGVINLSNCSNLKVFLASECGLTSVNLSECSKLEHISVWENQLETLDLSSCPNLMKAELARNRFADISFLNNLANLCYVDARGNPFDLESATYKSSIEKINNVVYKNETNKLMEQNGAGSFDLGYGFKRDGGMR